jgi:integrase
LVEQLVDSGRFGTYPLVMSSRVRRGAGQGGLIVKTDSAGRETYYGKWRIGQRQVMKRIGPKRTTNTREGLTRTQAEAALRRLMDNEGAALPRDDRRRLVEVCEVLAARKADLGRKASTVEAYRSWNRVHFEPFFGPVTVDRIDRRLIEAFDAELARKELSVKSRKNALGILNSVFDFAIREGWAGRNPVKEVESPVGVEVDADIHFLEVGEIDALLAGVPDDDLGRVERVMYLTAAMTGLRQGELLGLRWIDVDLPAGRIRVRRNFVRGEFGTPKSKRSTRSVPLATRLAHELENLRTTSTYITDTDLVFAHPHTGKPIDRSRLLKRFKAALRRADLREIRFHDLRHTFGTRMAAQGVPMRTLQEMLGHRDFKTTLIYADYAPSAREAQWIEEAFAPASESATS